MVFKPAAMRLVPPGRRALACRTEKPQRVGGGVLALAVDETLGQPDFPVPRPLIKVAFLGCLESSGRLEYHLRNCADVHKIKTVALDAVNHDISSHKHAEIALAFGFRAHEAGQQLDILGICIDDGHLRVVHILSGLLPLSGAVRLWASDYNDILFEGSAIGALSRPKIKVVSKRRLRGGKMMNKRREDCQRPVFSVSLDRFDFTM